MAMCLGMFMLLIKLKSLIECYEIMGKYKKYVVSFKYMKVILKILEGGQYGNR